jgi:hypothetical protein
VVRVVEGIGQRRFRPVVTHLPERLDGAYADIYPGIFHRFDKLRDSPRIADLPEGLSRLAPYPGVFARQGFEEDRDGRSLESGKFRPVFPEVVKLHLLLETFR